MTDHPTTTKERLMNKILSQLMMRCSDRIKPEHIEMLQQHKEAPGEFDSTPEEYASILDFNLAMFQANPELTEEQQAAPIELSRQEVAMQTIVEVSTALLLCSYYCYCSCSYNITPSSTPYLNSFS